MDLVEHGIYLIEREDVGEYIRCSPRLAVFRSLKSDAYKIYPIGQFVLLAQNREEFICRYIESYENLGGQWSYKKWRETVDDIAKSVSSDLEEEMFLYDDSNLTDGRLFDKIVPILRETDWYKLSVPLELGMSYCTKRYEELDSERLLSFLMKPGKNDWYDLKRATFLYIASLEIAGKIREILTEINKD